jgi:hypothetical protein
VQQQLGHASIKLTVDTYGRWLPLGNRAAVDRLDGPSGSKTVAAATGTDGGTPQPADSTSAPGPIRTGDPRIRNPVLYPPELRGRARAEGQLAATRPGRNVDVTPGAEQAWRTIGCAPASRRLVDDGRRELRPNTRSRASCSQLSTRFRVSDLLPGRRRRRLPRPRRTPRRDRPKPADPRDPRTRSLARMRGVAQVLRERHENARGSGHFRGMRHASQWAPPIAVAHARGHEG